MSNSTLSTATQNEANPQNLPDQISVTNAIAEVKSLQKMLSEMADMSEQARERCIKFLVQYFQIKS